MGLGYTFYMNLQKEDLNGVNFNQLNMKLLNYFFINREVLLKIENYSKALDI